MGTVNAASLRVAVIDDESLARERVLRLLDNEPDVEVVAQFASCGAAIEALPRLDVDLLVADICMEQAQAGLDLLERLSQAYDPAPHTVFVTAFAQHAVRAFELGAADYLLKPLDPGRFQAMLERVRRQVGGTTPASEPVQRAAGGTRRPQKIALKRGEHIQVRSVSEIDWLETAGNYVRVHLGKETFLVRETIQGFEAKFGSPPFVRVSRSVVVNLNSIVTLLPLFSRQVEVLLKDGTRLALKGPYRDRLREHVAWFY